MLLAVTFGMDQIGDVRHRVEELSRAHGLHGDDLDDWVMAVNELAINAIRHGSPTAELTLRLEDTLVCQVSDRGPGFDPGRYLGRAERPPLTANGGMGLWLVERTTTVVSLATGAAGTSIAVAARTR